MKTFLHTHIPNSKSDTKTPILEDSNPTQFQRSKLESNPQFITLRQKSQTVIKESLLHKGEEIQAIKTLGD